MHRIFLNFGDFEIRWFGVLIAIGFGAAIWLASRRAPKAGLSPVVVQELCFWIVLGGFAMARLFYVGVHWAYYLNHPIEILQIHKGGIVYYGGLTGGLVAGIIFARVKQLDFWKLADLIAPSLVLAHAFGRLGCFMNGCCYGRSCALPWGVEFPPDTVADWGPDAPQGAVHPTQLYEAFFLFYLCVSLVFIDKTKRFVGQTIASYALLYSLFRFIVEFWRGDVPRHAHLTLAQWISIVLFGASWWWLTVQRRTWAAARRAVVLAEIQQLREQAGEGGDGGKHGKRKGRSRKK